MNFFSYVVLMSGIELSNDNSEHMSSLLLAMDWISGDICEGEDLRTISRIVRVVVAGNSLSESTRDRAEMSKAKYLTKDTKAGSIDAVKTLDDSCLVQLASTVRTDVMPGEFDPANQTMPQQPLHRCLFPSRFPLVQLSCRWSMYYT